MNKVKYHADKVKLKMVILPSMAAFKGAARRQKFSKECMSSDSYNHLPS